MENESSNIATSLGPQCITDSATWVPIEAYLFRNRVLSVENCNLFRHNINIYTLKASKGNNLATMCCRNFSHSFPSLRKICFVRKLKEWTNSMNFHLNAAGSVHIFSLMAQKRDHNATLSLYCIYFTLGDAKMHFLSWCTEMRVELCWFLSLALWIMSHLGCKQ